MLLFLGGVLFAGYKLVGALVAEGQRMPVVAQAEVPVAAQAEAETASREDGVTLVDAPASRSIWRRLADALVRFASAVASKVGEVLLAAWAEVKPTLVKAVVAYAERLAPDGTTTEKRPHSSAFDPVIGATGWTGGAAHA